MGIVPLKRKVYKHFISENKFARTSVRKIWELNLELLRTGIGGCLRAAVGYMLGRSGVDWGVLGCHEHERGPCLSIEQYLSFSFILASRAVLRFPSCYPPCSIIYLSVSFWPPGQYLSFSISPSSLPFHFDLPSRPFTSTVPPSPFILMFLT